MGGWGSRRGLARAGSCEVVRSSRDPAVWGLWTQSDPCGCWPRCLWGKETVSHETRDVFSPKDVRKPGQLFCLHIVSISSSVLLLAGKPRIVSAICF